MILLIIFLKSCINDPVSTSTSWDTHQTCSRMYAAVHSLYCRIMLQECCRVSLICNFQPADFAHWSLTCYCWYIQGVLCPLIIDMLQSQIRIFHCWHIQGVLSSKKHQYFSSINIIPIKLIQQKRYSIPIIWHSICQNDAVFGG